MGESNIRRKWKRIGREKKELFMNGNGLTPLMDLEEEEEEEEDEDGNAERSK